MRLTKPAIARLALPENKSEAIVWDDALPGFGIRLRAGGKRTWIVQFRVGTKQRRVSLGTVDRLDLDKARDAAGIALAKVALGTDPQAERMRARSRASLTLAAIVDRYLEHKRSILRPRAFDEAERALRRHCKKLHGLAVDDIDRAAVAEMLGRIATNSGPVAADRTRANLSALFGWAMREGVVERNPVAATNKYAPGRERDRVLSDDELAEIWRACRDDDYGRITRLLLLTAARRDEIGSMQWGEVDFAAAGWTLPGLRSKNGRALELPLPDLALDLLRGAMQARAPAEGDPPRTYVFGRDDSGFSGWSKSKANLDARILEARREAAVERGDDPRKVKAPTPWRIHDLRRSAATRMADLGVQPHVVEALLNHAGGSKAGVAGIYNRSTYAPEKRAALTIWADHLRSITTATPAKVVPLATRGAA
ncbi:MAG: tyrosine-type recombinase/integrase [Alphaproteobacteria bacterium]